MTQATAKDIAAYLVNDTRCSFGNSFDGNMKLQKLLVFANLIHYAKYEEYLFNEDMYAFKNGIVVEDIRIPYYNDYYGYMLSLRLDSDFELSDEQIESVNMSIDIFNKLSAKELSDLHHELQTWKIKYENSCVGNNHIKELGLIRHEEILETDIAKIKKVISSYNNNKDDDYLCEIVNGITFFYDPEEIVLDNEAIIDYLESVSRSVEFGEGDTFFVSYDEEQGMYYY